MASFIKFCEPTRRNIKNNYTPSLYVKKYIKFLMKVKYNFVKGFNLKQNVHTKRHIILIIFYKTIYSNKIS